MPTRSRKRTRFVPQMILASAAATSVIPAVALVDCGGKVDSHGSSAPDAQTFGVAAVGVALAFEDGGEPDAPFFGVAAVFDAGEPDAPFFGVAAVFDAGEPDAQGFFVAASFDASEGGGHHHPHEDADVPDATTHDGSDDSGEG